MSALKTLENRLKQAAAGRPRQLAWGDLPAMRKSLEAVRASLGDKRGMTRAQRIAQSVMAFRLHGKEVDFVRLKYVCLGLTHPADWDARRLLDDETLLPALLQQVCSLRFDPRRFSICWRNLMTAFEEAKTEKTPFSPAATRNLERLAQFLRQE
jgi:hypothetical protein